MAWFRVVSNWSTSLLFLPSWVGLQNPLVQDIRQYQSANAPLRRDEHGQKEPPHSTTRGRQEYSATQRQPGLRTALSHAHDYPRWIKHQAPPTQSARSHA